MSLAAVVCLAPQPVAVSRIQRWEFIKENKKTLSRKKERKHSLDYKKATKKKRKKLSLFLGLFLGRERVFFLFFSYFLVFFYKFSSQSQKSHKGAGEGFRGKEKGRPFQELGKRL